MAVGGVFCRLRLDRTQPGVVDASLGQRIRLPCRAEGFPPPTIEWQRDGQLLSSPRFIGSSLPSCPDSSPTPSCGGLSRTPRLLKDGGPIVGLLGLSRVWLVDRNKKWVNRGNG